MCAIDTGLLNLGGDTPSPATFEEATSALAINRGRCVPKRELERPNVFLGPATCDTLTTSTMIG